MSEADPSPTAADLMAQEVYDILRFFERDAFGRLKSSRLRQLERIGLSMSASLDPLSFSLLKRELHEIRKAHERRSVAWRRATGL